MRNFVLHNPTKVLFGNGTVEKTGAEASFLGSRVMLLFGLRHALHAGLVNRVEADLVNNGLEVCRFGGIRANPVLAHVREGIALAKANRIDVLVALGGGSVIDSAKAVAAGCLVDHDVWKFFTGKKSLQQALPLVAVPTLAAAGSELNNGMVLTNEARQEKFGFGNRHLYPRTAILDPELTRTVPADLTAFGAVDMLCHVLEFYLSTVEPDTVVQDRIMEALMLSIMDSARRSTDDPADLAARADLLWSGALALSGLTAAGLGRVGFPLHLIAHAIGALHDLPHGRCLAMLLPGFLTWSALDRPQRQALLARRILSPCPAGAPADQAIALADALGSWLRRLAVKPGLAQCGFSQPDLLRIAECTRGQARIWRLREYPPQVVLEILAHCT